MQKKTDQHGKLVQFSSSRSSRLSLALLVSSARSVPLTIAQADLSTGSSPPLNWVLLYSFQKIETTLNYEIIAP